MKLKKKTKYRKQWVLDRKIEKRWKRYTYFYNVAEVSTQRFRFSKTSSTYSIFD